MINRIYAHQEMMVIQREILGNTGKRWDVVVIQWGFNDGHFLGIAKWLQKPFASGKQEKKELGIMVLNLITSRYPPVINRGNWKSTNKNWGCNRKITNFNSVFSSRPCLMKQDGKSIIVHSFPMKDGGSFHTYVTIDQREHH